MRSSLKVVTSGAQKWGQTLVFVGKYFVENMIVPKVILVFGERALAVTQATCLLTLLRQCCFLPQYSVSKCPFVHSAVSIHFVSPIVLESSVLCSTGRKCGRHAVVYVVRNFKIAC
jgi:hypothetical protein